MLLAQLAIAASPPLGLSGGLGSRFAACYLRGGCLRAHGLLARVSLGVGDGLCQLGGSYVTLSPREACNTGQVVAELKVVTSNKLCEPIL